MNTCVVIAALFTGMTLPPGIMERWAYECLRVAHMYAGVASHPMESCGCLVLLQSESVWMSFLNSFLPREGERGLALRVLSVQLLLSKGRGSREESISGVEFQVSVLNRKRKKFRPEFSLLYLGELWVRSVQHQRCSELDWGPPRPQRWIRCLQHQQSVLGDAELHPTGPGYTFKMN